MERAILHLDMDCFFVSVERIRNKALNGKPVIIGGASDRGVVAACSYEARKFGVRSAMPMRFARQLCPEAITMRGDFESYDKMSDLVTEIIEEKAPLYEKNSIDEFNCDLTGMDRYVGCWSWALELKSKIIKESGLSLTVGLSENRTISKIAANEAKPNGQIRLEKVAIQPFINPLSVSKIPMVGEVTAQTLRNMGVNSIGTLSIMPILMLERTFGKAGRIMWERANGIDNTPIIPYTARKSISKETTYQTDTTDLFQLKSTLIRMVEQLGYDLRIQNQCTCQITVKIRYSNFDTYTLQAGLTATSSDHILIGNAVNLFDKLYDRRLLIRLIGVAYGKLVIGKEQLSIFDDSSKTAPLYSAMDKIKKKYGENAIGRAYGFKTKQ